MDMTKLIAYHEAAHAVASCLVGKRFRKVTIIPSEEFRGRCETKPWENFHPDYKTDSRTVRKCKANIFIDLAGLVAEAICGHKKKQGSKDFSNAADMAGYLCGSSEEVGAFLSFMWEETYNILRLEFNWKSVQVVAGSLLKKKVLRYGEVRHLILRTQDGLPIRKVDLL